MEIYIFFPAQFAYLRALIHRPVLRREREARDTLQVEKRKITPFRPLACLALRARAAEPA